MVVAEVARDDDEDVERCEQLRRVARIGAADRDRQHGQRRATDPLQKRQLDFDRVVGRVRFVVDPATGRNRGAAQRLVHRNVAERRRPLRLHARDRAAVEPDEVRRPEHPRLVAAAARRAKRRRGHRAR